jgi:hypothetical protein
LKFPYKIRRAGMLCAGFQYIIVVSTVAAAVFATAERKQKNLGPTTALDNHYSDVDELIPQSRAL